MAPAPDVHAVNARNDLSSQRVVSAIDETYLNASAFRILCMPLKIVPIGFTYRLDYVPVGRRNSVSAELEGSAFAAIEELTAEEAPVAIRISNAPRHGRRLPDCIRAHGHNLLWPLLQHNGSAVPAESYLKALVDGTAFPGADGEEHCYSLKRRRLETVDKLAIRRRVSEDFDERVGRLQRRVAQLRIIDGYIWIVGVEPVYIRCGKCVRLFAPPALQGMLAPRPPESDRNAYSSGAVRGDVFSLDEFELAVAHADWRKREPFVELMGWRARTDPIQLQLREMMRSIVSEYLLDLNGNLPRGQAIVSRVVHLGSVQSLPYVEESAAALSDLADVLDRDPEAAEYIGSAARYARACIDTVIRSCASRGRASPFRLKDADEQALLSLAEASA